MNGPHNAPHPPLVSLFSVFHIDFSFWVIYGARETRGPQQFSHCLGHPWESESHQTWHYPSEFRAYRLELEAVKKMSEAVIEGIHATDTKCRNICSIQGTLCRGEGLDDDSVLELLKRLDMDIAYSSEKLHNLELCIGGLSIGKNDLPAESDIISEEQTERILVLDLSLCYLDSELIMLGNFLVSRTVEAVDVHDKVILCGKVGEMLTLVQEKLHNAEASLKKLHEKQLEIKEKRGALHKIIFGPTFSYMAAEEILEAFKLDTVENKKFLMRILDKFIAEKIDLEIKLLETKQSKEDLMSKLYVADQALSSMEETMELALRRLVEAENSAELFKGMSKEMFSQLQAFQYILKGSLKQEDELESKILTKENAMLKPDRCARSNLGQVVDVDIDHQKATFFYELNSFAEKSKILEKDQTDSQSQLRRTNLSEESGHTRQSTAEMEDIIESMRNCLCIAETRAGSVEAKLAELTEDHLELTDEHGFLNEGESSAEKISFLEKQVRDLEGQLLQAKASSEAGQEHQNMLYSAIWDMETLIEDLKSKVSAAEIKLEIADERCLVLAETNSELNKEIYHLKSKSESLEASLKEANRLKLARAKDINGGTKLITDTVVRLAVEREKIQKQVFSLATENRLLMGELRRIRRNVSVTTKTNKVETDKEPCFSVSSESSRTNAPAEKLPETPSTQMNRLLEAEISSEVDGGCSTAPSQSALEQQQAPLWQHEIGEREQRTMKRDLSLGLRYYITAVLVPIIAVGAMTVVYKQEIFASYLRKYAGL